MVWRRWRKWWDRLWRCFVRKKAPCAYCKEDPRSILCRGGGVVRIVPHMQMAVFAHSWKSDQFDIRYCPKCGRRL